VFVVAVSTIGSLKEKPSFGQGILFVETEHHLWIYSPVADLNELET